MITMTTAGFGGIPPKTDLRRVITSVMMLVGWGTPAVPTGIAGAEFSARRIRHEPTLRTCHERLSEGHLPGARFLRDCGVALPAWQRDAGGAGGRRMPQRVRLKWARQTGPYGPSPQWLAGQCLRADEVVSLQ